VIAQVHHFGGMRFMKRRPAIILHHFSEYADKKIVNKTTVADNNRRNRLLILEFIIKYQHDPLSVYSLHDYLRVIKDRTGKELETL